MARIIGLKKGPRPISWEEIRRQIPARSSEAVTETDGDSTQVSAPIDRRIGFSGKLARSIGRRDAKTYELDSVGSFVWNLIDGANNVEAITHRLRAKYRLSRLETEVSLIEFLRLMEQRGLIEWIG